MYKRIEIDLMIRVNMEKNRENNFNKSIAIVIQMDIQILFIPKIGINRSVKKKKSVTRIETVMYRNNFISR